MAQPRSATPGSESGLGALYEEIRETLQISWVPAVFSDLGAVPGYLPLAWEQLKPAALTEQFRRLAERIRGDALAVARSLYLPSYGPGRLQQLAVPLADLSLIRTALAALLFGQSQTLLATKALRLAIECSPPGGRHPIWWPRAATTWALEAIPVVDLATIADEGRRVFRQAQSALGLPRPPRALAVLAIWPRYLSQAWNDLQGVLETPEFAAARTELVEQSSAYSDLLPTRINVTPDWLRSRGVDEVIIDRARNVLLSHDRVLPATLLLTACLRLPLDGVLRETT